jgi:hypothetical protein
MSHRTNGYEKDGNGCIVSSTCPGSTRLWGTCKLKDDVSQAAGLAGECLGNLVPAIALHVVLSCTSGRNSQRDVILVLQGNTR